MNGEALALLGLGLSVVGTAIGVSRWIHGQFADLNRDVDKRLDQMANDLSALRADFRVEAKDNEAHHIRLDAWCKANHDELKHHAERLRITEKGFSRRLGDLELFLAKTLSFVVRERD